MAIKDGLTWVETLKECWKGRLVNRTIYDCIKRALDVAAAGSCLVVTSPIIAIAALVVLIRMGRPVLFSQERPGKDGKIFRLWKFRTMLSPDPGKGLIEDDQRLTPLGQLLRSTSLDELPSLVNVLLGDMSIVGPRPLLVRYLDRYSLEQMRRHQVRPGITGLAQCKGRNALTWDEKFAWDIAYIESRSLLLDAKILVWTIRSVIRREGISSNQHATMPEFFGSTLDSSEDVK